jgi:hypothetical protein
LRQNWRSDKSAIAVRRHWNEMDQHLAQRLLREARDLLQSDLGEWIEELGPGVAEELQTLANATRDDARKADYLRLRIDLQGRWDTLTEAFRGHLAKHLQPIRVLAKGKAEAPAFAELQLVDDQELTARIVMREFVARVSEACSEETYALERRLAHLHGHEEPAEDDGQLSPPAICAALEASCEDLYSDVGDRTIVLRQLERHLQAELAELYGAVNEIFVQADVLPRLKRSYRRAVPGGTLAAAADADNIMGTLQRLAQARQQDGGKGMPAGGAGLPGASGGGALAEGAVGGGGAGAPAGSIALDPAFLQSLQALQSMPMTSAGSLTNVVRLARDSDAARQAAPLEAITLDIVAMLFDMIFDDRKVPSGVKALISRLQIPVLKVAMADRRFFADRGHPARRFLDSISGISIRWGETVNDGDPFYVELSRLVERIHDTFDENPDIFGTAISELAGFVTKHEALEAETSRVVAEAVERKEIEQKAQGERQAAARQSAEASLAALLAAAMPRPIEQFLRGQWRAVLQKVALLSGADSPRYRTAERIAGELVWSVTPKRDPEERKRLVALLPKLLHGMQQGLDQIGISAAARRPILDALVALHSAAIRADVQGQNAVPELTDVAVPVDIPAVVLQVEHSVESGVSVEEVSLPDSEAPAETGALDKAALRHVKHLVRGAWVEFIDDDGASRRERLTWISPRRTLFLFSNHATNCAISITPEALAYRLKMDTARLVEHDAPMFERALDGAIKQLDKTAPSIGGLQG